MSKEKILIVEDEGLNIPVIYLTAHADESTLQRAKVTEAFGYILQGKRFANRD